MRQKRPPKKYHTVTERAVRREAASEARKIEAFLGRSTPFLCNLSLQPVGGAHLTRSLIMAGENEVNFATNFLAFSGQFRVQESVHLFQ
jgi:hypothetical protein